MAQHKTTPAPGAVVIPFPHFSRPEHRKAPIDFKSSDFDAGFEFAMTLVKSLKARGYPVSQLKGA